MPVLVISITVVRVILAEIKCIPLGVEGNVRVWILKSLIRFVVTRLLL